MPRKISASCKGNKLFYEYKFMFVDSFSKPPRLNVNSSISPLFDVPIESVNKDCNDRN